MDNNSGIYKITYREKVYIGQSKNLGKRMEDHLRELRKNKHYNIYLQNAFNKYSEDDYKIEVIEHCEEDCLDEREIYWIEYYDSYKSGYNQTSGGTGLGYNSKQYRYAYIKYRGKNKKVHKIINLSTGKVYDNYQEVKTEYGLKNLGHLHKVCKGFGYKCKDNFWCYDYYGINIEEELKLAESRYKEYIESSNIKVINITTGQVFDSLNKAAIHYKIPCSSVVLCVNGKQKSTHGYTFMKLDDYNNANTLHIEEPRIKATNRKAKSVINVNTGTIYKSMYEASKQTKISYSNISECCNHKRPSAGGYQWEFYNENMDIDKIPKREKQFSSAPKKIINLTTGIIYNSANQASRELNVNINSILRVCKKKQKTTGGYRFEFYEE